MPASRRRYTWSYVPPGPQAAGPLALQALGTLEQFCEDWPQWYSEPEVKGWSVGQIQISIVVTSRDRWWVEKRAKRALSALRAFTDMDERLIKEVSVERLPPHDHRSAQWLAEHRSPSTA